MDLVGAIEVKAYLAVTQGDDEAWLRHALRWYSKTFSTPLHEVGDLPLEDVLQAYFEDRFEQMDEEDLEQVRERLIETPEERAERLKGEQSAPELDDRFFDNLNAEVKAGMVQKPPKEHKRKLDLSGPPTALAGLANRIGKLKAKAKKMETQLPEAPPAPELPEIKMDFGESNLFDEDLTLDPLAPPKKR